MAFIIFFMGCVHLPHVEPRPRTIRGQELTTVELSVWCNDVQQPARSASGVIIDERHVLTAYHAVACAEIPMVRAVFNGKMRTMVVVKEDPKADLAKLELLAAENFKLNIPPPVIVPAEDGGYACSSVAYPKAEWSCGKVTADPAAPAKGDLKFEAQTVGGNSGSAVYDLNGRIIGIIVEKVACARGGMDGCTGTITSLYGKTAFYPK